MPPPLASRSAPLAALLVVTALSALGCSGGTSGVAPSAESARAPEPQGSSPAQPGPAPASPAPGPKLTFEPTAALIKQAALAALVDDLAKEGTLESSHIGAGGAPSMVYKKFEALLAAAKDADLLALLRHDSPVVRGYVAQHLARSQGAALANVRPLADDATMVKTLEGCMGGSETVSSVVLDALCWSSAPEAGALLGELAQRDDDVGARALGCAARFGGAAVTKAIDDAITDGSRSHATREAALRAFTLSPVAARCGSIRALAERPGDKLRQVALGALSRCTDSASQATLEAAAADSVASIASEAKIALLLSPATSESRRKELAADTKLAGSASPRLQARARSHALANDQLQVIEALVGLDANLFSQPLWDVKTSAGASSMMRRLATTFGPSSSKGQGANPRLPVLRYLARLKDTADKAELKRSLSSADPREVQAALDGLVAMKATDVKPQVEALAKSSDPSIARFAKDAAAKL
ncbi:MAG: hypothetical protein IPM79_07065 [Polyangiaceae bacterium]|jgi:hypothetical protein|nr:hypothetical protein [Polyangiaceae bacterium]MBK8937397.1 hypothetical protein [Polyangiaceae bacterium]